MENTDLIILWGSNAREAHPVMFHHMMKSVRRRHAKLVVVDPRRISGVEFASLYLPVQVGGDVALANAVGSVILEEGLENREFIGRATEGIDVYRERVRRYRPEDVEHLTGVPAASVRELARLYARADRAIICWTLGITEHHNAVQNVHALINLALLTGKVGRYGSGLAPLRGQNNVQGGGDMGALPNRLPGFQDVTDPAARQRCERVWGMPVPDKVGKHQTAMFKAMADGELRALYVIGENPVQSEANLQHVRRLFEGLEFLLVQDLFLTPTAELADVVLPASASFAEAEGTVTNSERRVQRLRPALKPPGEARDDLWIVEELAIRMGVPGWTHRTAEEVWDELRQVSPLHGGMSYRRLEELGGIQWPCPTEDHPGTPFLHGRLWEDPVVGKRAPFVVADHEPTAEQTDREYPFMLTTGRRLADYNTGVQSRHYLAPRGHREVLEMCEEDMRRLGLAEGDLCRLSSRRGSVEVQVAGSRKVRPGLLFMSLNHPDEVPTNLLTLDATDPVAGTAEFKATAVRVERAAAQGPGGRIVEEAAERDA